MKKILKSYMKTFIKNWVSSLFIIVFLASLTTAIIGILASPIQIYLKLHSSENKTVKYDNKIDLDNSQSVIYSYDFIEKYFMAETSPIESEGINILKSNANVNIDLNSISDFQTEKDNLTNVFNNFLASYRTSSIGNLSLSKKTFLTIFKDEEIKKVIYLHITKAISEAIFELESSSSDVTSQDISSAFFGALYKIFLFANLNKLIDFSIFSLVDQLKNWNEKNLNELINLMVNNFKKSEAQEFYFLNYALIKSEYSKKLWNKNYLHDDRVIVLEKIIEEISKNKKANYELSVSQSFKLAPSQGIFGGKNTADLKSEYSWAINTKEKKYSDITKVLFDKSIAKNSENTHEWKADLNDNPEVIISAAFAKLNNIKVGDYINLPEANSSQFGTFLNFLSKEEIFNNIHLTEMYFTNSFKVKVVGIGQNLEDFFPGPSYSSFNQKQNNYAIVYANNNFTQRYKNFEWKFLNSSESTGALSLKIKSEKTSDKLEAQDFIFKKNNDEDFLIFQKPSSFLKKWSDSNFDKQSTNLKIRIIIFIVISFVILLLAFLFINFNIKKEINETRKQLGIFKSSGYFTTELSWVFALKTFVLFFTSILIGFFCSFPFQKFAARGFENSLTIYFNKVYFSPIMFLVIVIGIPLFFLFIAFLFTLKDLNEKPLSLINNDKKRTYKTKKSLLSKISEKHNIFFSWRLRKAFIKNSKGKFVMIQTLFAFSSLSYILIFGSQTLTTKIINQSFAVYNEKVDHYYDWTGSYSKYVINSQKKYDWDQSKQNPIELDYKDISDFKNTNDYLTSEDLTNDYRYKVSALAQMTINYFNSLSDEDKVQFILPQNEVEYTIQKTFGFDLSSSPDGKTISDVNFLSTILNFDLNSDSLKEGIFEIKTTGKTNKKITLESLESSKNENTVTLKNITEAKLKNIFYNELTQLFAIKMFQIAAIYEYLPVMLNKPNSKFTTEELVSAFASNEKINFNYDQFINITSNLPLLKNYNPAKSVFWKTGDNNEMFKHTSSILSDTKQFNDSQIISLLYKGSLNLLPSTLSSNLLISDTNENTLTDKMINFNSIMFDKNKETLTSKIYLNIGDKSDESLIQTYLLSNQTSKYGDFRKTFNFYGINNNQMNEFLEPSDGVIPAIIPYFLHRDKNINIGDILTLHSNTSEKLEIKVKVVGINQAETISLGQDSIMLNKESFENQYFNNDLLVKPVFNQLFSYKEMLSTEMSFSNIITSFLKTINKEENITITSDKQSNVFYEMIYGVFEETKEKPLEVISSTTNDLKKQNTFLITNQSFLTKYRNSSVPFNIMKSAANFAIEISNKIMFVFVLLSTVILSIILLVVIGIIVDESKATILTMKALGYKKMRVNWTIMGSYIIGLLISFAIAFILSIIIWQVLLHWVSVKFSVYIFLGVDYRSALITAPIVFVVLIFGWFVANKQVEKLSLSQITNI
ncbi:ABC transporter permease [Entomoplasma ellychniae]|uniref:ABC transporter permease n=2 Tax=Entomoplasma ellychniae TaxID=2114 RepID=A0A8E2UAK3_9MOLU|nr:ABC transporter permease [Entomoplasma ellychniae]